MGKINLNPESGGIPIFSQVSEGSSKEMACSVHASSIKTPLQEPAGVWFENCGGWDCQCPAAIPVPVEVSKDVDQGSGSAVMLNSNDLGAKVTDRSTGLDGVRKIPGVVLHRLGSSEQTQTTLCQSVSTAGVPGPMNEKAILVPPQEHPSSFELPLPAAVSPEPVEQKPRKLGDTSTFDIPGYRWQIGACIQGELPPLRPGEGRVLGVTMTSPVYAAYCRATTAFNAAAAENKTLRHVVPLFEVGDTFTKASLKRISNAVEKAIFGSSVKADNFQSVTVLPERVMCHNKLETFCIDKDDPRRGLAADKNPVGVRVKSGGGAIRAFELLGIYGGLQLFHEDFNVLLEDEQLAMRLGFDCKQQLATQLNSYGADEGT